MSQHSQTHRVVMQVNRGSSADQKIAIDQIRNVLKALPECKIEVVCHGQAVQLVLKKASEMADEIAGLAKDQFVEFLICQNTLTQNDHHQDEILPEVKVVPSALAHIIVRQGEGWAYIKGGR
ncbi:DsrE family protein [Fulvivirga ligni]|uniref:DsrE family protein n=1 Tax=Fulvivirga ligni TaxID=2904246 RepID=UPI001F209C6E|nr:DsrE family protein [Fulvivirga ligni]UII22819.1 DsrE family protein [Fulvivirga ligni]